MTAPVVELDGRTLTSAQVRDVVHGLATVRISAAGLGRARAAARTAAAVAARREVYGRTTGVGANRDQQVGFADLSEHGLRLLRSHAGGGGPLVAPELSRAMLVVRANQIAAGGSGVDPGVLGPLTDGINAGLSVPVPRYGAIGTGDLTALAATALCLRGERDWLPAQIQQASGQVAPGHLAWDVLGRPVSGRPVPGRPAPGRPAPGQSAPGRPAPGQPAPGQPAPGRPVPGRPAEPESWQPRFALASADALAFLSSNAATIGEAALACAELSGLMASSIVIAALSHAAVGASAEPYAAAVHEARSYPGQRAVASALRGLVDPGAPAARIQDPYGYRALPQVHGPALDALAAANRAVSAELNAAAENPLVDVAGAAIWHNGNFHTVSLGLALDALRAALFQTAALSAARLGTLVEPAFTGLAPFLATDPPPSSGIMILEYVAHSAVADIRRLAAPAALGSAVLSRGVEEHAGFSTQSARATTEVTGAYRIALACELVAAVRALRMRGIRPATARLSAAFDLAAAALPSGTADRALDADLTQAQNLLPALSAMTTAGTSR